MTSVNQRSKLLKSLTSKTVVSRECHSRNSRTGARRMFIRSNKIKSTESVWWGIKPKFNYFRRKIIVSSKQLI